MEEFSSSYVRITKNKADKALPNKCKFLIS